MEKKTTINYIEVLKKKFAEEKLPHEIMEEDGKTVFVLPVRVDECPGMFLMLQVEKIGDVRIRSFPVGRVSEDERIEVVRRLNQLNVEYRFVSLSMDDDGEICVAADFILFGDEKTACEQMMTMLEIYAGICAKCTAELMRDAWNKKGIC